MTSDRFPFLTRLGRAAIRHPDGWEVRSHDRHRIEYCEGAAVAHIGVEDLVRGVVLYAKTLDWVSEPDAPRQTDTTAIIARCALALEAMEWGDVRVEWGTPRWGETGPGEAFCFAARCVVRIDRDVGVAEYEGSGGHILVPIAHEALQSLARGDASESLAWVIRRDGQVPDHVIDRVVEGILFLTGDPVQGEPHGRGG